MDIIYHTADMDKDIVSLEKLLSGKESIIELDFVMTKDGIPIWTHDLFPTRFLKSDSFNLKGQLTLFDVLDINNHRCKLMLDLKYMSPKIVNSSEFFELLKMLNHYDEMQIQSLDLAVLNRLIDSNFSNLEIGLIVNILTRHLINGFKSPKLSNINFMSLSSELWEQRDGKYIDDCGKLYPNVKKYAWTWTGRNEDDERINNFLEKNADGIITSNPELVRSMVRKRKINGK